MEFLFLLGGLAFGAVVAYLYVRSTLPSQVERAVQDHPVMAELRSQRERLDGEVRAERVEKERLIAELASVRRELATSEERLKAQAQELIQIQEKLQREFQHMAQLILDRNSEKFTRQNKEQMDAILGPLRERIKDFEQKVEKTYDEEKGERIRLKKEIEDLVNLNKKLSEDAENLTSALRGDNKTQGNWGELILEKILERSGLKEGQEYVVQHSTENTDGSRIRPDVVIFLPDGKHLIIDSKVSLLAYSNMAGAPDEASRNAFLRQHIDSVRAHIRGLSDKNYHSAPDLRSPDFILLFMPVEGAFAAALQSDTDLFSYAWEKRIVLVSPSTLLATLRTVENIWRQEKRSRYADQIAEEAGKLYDKFVGFTTDLLEIGKKMNSAKESYDDAMRKLSQGPGNLVRRLEAMKGFSSKGGSRSINEKLLERAMEEPEGDSTE